MKNKFIQTAGVHILAVAMVFLIQNINVDAQSIQGAIIGKWIIESTGDEISGGHIVFQTGEKYEFYRKYPDGTGAGTKGGYVFNKEGSNGTLRLCIGDCSAAGSEWTSSFALVRLTGENRLEIYFSDDGEFPKEFPKTKDEKGMYVFVRE
jgi:hypothetical protein